MFSRPFPAAALALALLAAPLCAHAGAPDFAGRWVFSAAKSRNVGMMAQVAVSTQVTQSTGRVVVDDTSQFGGRTYLEHTVYDLAGGVSTNASPMTGASTGHSHWDGAALTSDWERPGAVPGSTLRRTETRRLSADGRSMVVESRSDGKAPMIMVFERP
jgi:hypothetical protein